MNAPRRVVTDPEKDERDLARVQKWVMSVLAVTTILHLVGGLLIAAVLLDGPPSSRVGLAVIAGIFGALAVATGRAIHGKQVLSPWLLLGTVPCAVGLWLVLR